MAKPSLPGPLRTHELGVMPRANTGSPAATMPSRSRAMPSVTMAADALVLGHHRQVVADPGRGREAVAGGDDHVARLGNDQRRHDREVVVGAALAGQRRADELRALGIDRLDVVVERAAALQGVDDVAGLRAGELGDAARARGRLKSRRMVSSGGSFSIAFLPSVSSVAPARRPASAQ